MPNKWLLSCLSYCLYSLKHINHPTNWWATRIELFFAAYRSCDKVSITWEVEECGIHSQIQMGQTQICISFKLYYVAWRWSLWYCFCMESSENTHCRWPTVDIRNWIEETDMICTMSGLFYTCTHISELSVWTKSNKVHLAVCLSKEQTTWKQKAFVISD